MKPSADSACSTLQTPFDVSNSRDRGIKMLRPTQVHPCRAPHRLPKQVEYLRRTGYLVQTGPPRRSPKFAV